MRIHKFHLFMPAAAMALCLGACTSSGDHIDGVALQGTMTNDSIQDFVLSYNLEGDISRYRTIEITRDAEGHFQIPDSVLPTEGTHATIMADEAGYFGLWLEPGKTAVMNITGAPGEKMKAVFSGENADINELYNDIVTTYDIMIYSPQDPSERMSKEDAMARLARDRKRINEKVETLANEQKRQYYKELAGLLSDRMEGFIIEDAAYDADLDPMDDPAYQALIKHVDPNSDAALESAMIYLWLKSAAKDDPEASAVENCINQLKKVDSVITNRRTRKALYNMVPHNFFSYSKPTPEEAAEFVKHYSELAKDYPEFIDTYTLHAQGVKVVEVGDALSYDPEIVTPDGKKCRLSSLYGKVLYIDFWATWCGPCCKQIPHLEKLVEKMKDLQGLEFISISCDSEIDAWKAKLAKDKPVWPQYIFAEGEDEKFMTSMNITGIPRFMIIGPDGKLISPDASMPSDPKTEQTLRDCLK